MKTISQYAGTYRIVFMSRITTYFITLANITSEKKQTPRHILRDLFSDLEELYHKNGHMKNFLSPF